MNETNKKRRDDERKERQDNSGKRNYVSETMYQVKNETYKEE